MSDDTPESEVPVRRVSFTVTGYLRHGHPVGGWYDMQSAADGGMTYSIPQCAVDEDSVCDAAPEQLSDDDWNEIRGQVAARVGSKEADLLIIRFRAAALGRVDVPGDHGPGIRQFRQLQDWITSGEARRMRIDAALTVAFAAQAVGVTQGAVSRWESGGRAPRGRNASAYFRFLSELAAAENARAAEVAS